MSLVTSGARLTERPPDPGRRAGGRRSWTYFETDGGTESVNGLIELHRRVACGFRNRHNHHLRTLLIDGGLN